MGNYKSLLLLLFLEDGRVESMYVSSGFVIKGRRTFFY